MFFTRLRRALGRQDWFAVLLEVTIVVAGVVIGFQITAWGQTRADAEKERAYLVQIAEDMRQTEDRIAGASARTQKALQAQRSLLLAFRTPERPRRDSLASWLFGSFNTTYAAPILGTTRALVATGDLALIRDDSLRQALPAYLERAEATLAGITQARALFNEAYTEINGRVDFYEAVASSFPPALVDTLTLRQGDRFPFPVGERRVPFPFEVEALLTDRQLYAATSKAFEMTRNMESSWQRMLRDAETLHTHIERVLGER